MAGECMKDVIYQSKQLNMKIRQSNEYNHYIRTKNRLKEDEELYSALNEFRRRNFELQSSNENINMYDEITTLANEYEKILHNSKVNEFLVAEQRICRLMQDVYSSMADSLDFDFGFIN